MLQLVFELSLHLSEPTHARPVGSPVLVCVHPNVLPGGHEGVMLLVGQLGKTL